MDIEQREITATGPDGTTRTLVCRRLGKPDETRAQRGPQYSGWKVYLEDGTALTLLGRGEYPLPDGGVIRSTDELAP